MESFSHAEGDVIAQGHVEADAPSSDAASSAEARRLQSRSAAYPTNSTAYVEMERRAAAMLRMRQSAAAMQADDPNGARWAREDIAAVAHVRADEQSVALDAIHRNVSANRAYAVTLEHLAPDLVEAAARNTVEFERIESVPGAFMRQDPFGKGAEVSDRGAHIVLRSLADIEDWAQERNASNVDKERLVSLALQEKNGPAGADHQSTLKESVQMQDHQQQVEVKRIGANMPKPDWQMAIDLLKARAPDERGKVYIPKAGAEYGGQVLMFTDTHIVQRVGRGTAIAHDLDKLTNGREIHGDIDAGKIKPGMHMNVQYGDERGNAKLIPFNQQRAQEIQRDLTAWAEKNLTNAKGRETFLKHLTAATKELGQAPAAQRAAPQHNQQHAPARAMQRER